MKKYFFLFFSVVLIACSNRPVRGFYSYGQKEFLQDSILIQQGSSGISKLLNKECNTTIGESAFEDTIKDGDVFSIFIFNTFLHPWIDCIKNCSLQGNLLVVGGLLNLPYFGKIDLHNLTLQQAKEKIEKKIQEEFPEALASIELKDRWKVRVELDGVIRQSVPLLEKYKTLYQLLTQFPYPKEVSFSNSYIKREGKILSLDIEKLMTEKNFLCDCYLHPQDYIYLADQKTAKVMVLGEVKKEGVITLEHSKIPLKEVLAKAGGIELSADRTFIQIIRGSMDLPKIYTLSYQQILKAPNESMLLMQGDILYVAATPIAEWNRLIQQILPSITTYEFFHKGIQGVIIP